MRRHVGRGLADDCPDADVLLGAVLEAVSRTGTDAITVLEPIADATGEVEDFRILASAGLTRRLATSWEGAIGRTVREAVPAPQAEELVALNRAVLLCGESERHDFALPPAPDETGEPRRTGEVVRTVVGGLVVVLWRDVTEARAAEQERRRSEDRFRRLLEHASDAVLIVDGDGTITYASPAVRTLTGCAPEDVVGRAFGTVVHLADAEIALDLLHRAATPTAETSATASLRVLTTAGDEFRWVRMTATSCGDDPAVGGVVVNVRDETEQRKAEHRLQQEALRDPLTTLPNRRGFHDALTTAVARTARSGRPFGLLLVDVDDFKVVNDSLGHPAGDALLLELARRMAGALRPVDTVARLGGDEFVVLTEDLHAPADAQVVARRVAEHASGAYALGPLTAHVTLSIGVATTHDSDAGPCLEHDVLFAHADAALYEAKRGGRNRIEVSNPALRRRVVERRHVEHELQHALAAGEGLLLHWQPVVRTSDGRIVGAEALLRWHHPVRGLLRAAEFLPVAAEAGLAGELCAWAVRAAIEQAGRWERLPDPPVISVNLVTEQLTRPGVAEELAALAAAHGVPTARVQFEVSERFLDGSAPVLRDRLAELRALGFGTALDDFGAGGSALAWLRQMPLDALKLHPSFVTAVHEESTRAVVRAVVALAATLGIRTVAEGVETPEQLAVLREVGCDETQGFLHARPLPEAELTALLASR